MKVRTGTVEPNSTQQKFRYKLVLKLLTTAIIIVNK